MRRREGELVELSVDRIGAAGDGVARWRGEPVFLPFAAPGDHVRVRLGSRRGGGLEGHVVELLDSGLDAFRRLVAISGAAGDVLCSTSTPISTGRSSSSGC